MGDWLIPILLIWAFGGQYYIQSTEEYVDWAQIPAFSRHTLLLLAGPVVWTALLLWHVTSFLVGEDDEE